MQVRGTAGVGSHQIVNPRLLHYEIVREIGRGGMGIVYQARDTHLGRLVAIKVLPPDKVADPSRKRRFIQEARAASALNHSNIITVHDVNSDNGLDFMVMEYVDGKTLDKLIPSKGLQPALALKYAVQIADALAKAHDAGILHRDLKPSNLMVTTEGRIKVVDFGLAKLKDATESSHNEPTLTGEGAVMGTASYMSPEQAEGGSLDRRSDIFSFGSVLYEMITGHKAFTGDSPASTVAKILREDPKPMSQLAPSVPPDLAKVVSRCLRKDPARRYQYMADVKVALEDVQDDSPTRRQVPAARRGLRLGSAWVTLASVLLAVGVAVLGWRQLRPTGGSEPLRAVPLTTFAGMETHPTISPDGSHVAFSGWGPTGDNAEIYVQRIDSGVPLRLTKDPAPDFSPAWSSDGRWIAFLRRATLDRCELRLIRPLGGPERMLAELHVSVVSLFRYLAWLPDGSALIAVDSSGPHKAHSLFVISAETGEKTPLTNPTLGDDTNPAVSPDGRFVAFCRRPSDDLHVLTLGKDLTAVGEPRRLTQTTLRAAHPTWMPDGKEIVFSVWATTLGEGGLWRVDAAGTRAPARIPFVGDGGLMPVLSRSQPGGPARLVYVRVADSDANIWRVNTPAAGRPASSLPVPAIASSRRDLNPQFSPDGRRVAFFSDRSGTGEIWIADPDDANAVQLTSMRGFSGTPRWSPDGQTIAFDSNLDGRYQIYVIPAGGSRPRRLTFHESNNHVPSFSRDGRWIYFSSNRTGGFQIWKVPADGGDAEQVTHNGGFVAFESPDGASLYYTQTSTSVSTLWRLPTAGGEPVKVLDGVVRRAFAVLEKGIYYIEEPAQPEGGAPILAPGGPLSWTPAARLRFFDFATRTSKIVANLGERIGVGLTASPDGRTILYSKNDARPMSDLMLVENFR